MENNNKYYKMKRAEKRGQKVISYEEYMSKMAAQTGETKISVIRNIGGTKEGLK